MIVAATQLLVYRTTESPWRELAARVRARDSAWASPFLWRSEFRSAVLGQVRNGGIDLADAINAFGSAQRIVAGREHHVDTRTLFDLSSGTRMTAYDLEFATLARTLGVQLVTFDKQILAELPAIAVHPEQFLAT